MPALNRLMDRAREARNITSDNALAAKLGLSGNAVNKWRKGGSIRDEHLAQLLELAGESNPAAFAEVRAELAETRAEQRLWGAVLDRLRPAAAVAGIALMASLIPLPADAATPNLNGGTGYALCEVRRRLARLLQRLRFLMPRSRNASPVLA